MQNIDEKEYFKFLKDGVVETYEFVPEYNRWVNMDEQKKIVNKLENITKNKENGSN